MVLLKHEVYRFVGPFVYNGVFGHCKYKDLWLSGRALGYHLRTRVLTFCCPGFESGWGHFFFFKNRFFGGTHPINYVVKTASVSSAAPRENRGLEKWDNAK